MTLHGTIFNFDHVTALTFFCARFKNSHVGTATELRWKSSALVLTILFDKEISRTNIFVHTVDLTTSLLINLRSIYLWSHVTARCHTLVRHFEIRDGCWVSCGKCYGLTHNTMTCTSFRKAVATKLILPKRVPGEYIQKWTVSLGHMRMGSSLPLFTFKGDVSSLHKATIFLPKMKRHIYNGGQK